MLQTKSLKGGGSLELFVTRRDNMAVMMTLMGRFMHRAGDQKTEADSAKKKVA